MLGEAEHSLQVGHGLDSLRTCMVWATAACRAQTAVCSTSNLPVCNSGCASQLEAAQHSAHLSSL